MQAAITARNTQLLSLLVRHPQLDTSGGVKLHPLVGLVGGEVLGKLAGAGFNVNVQREEGALLVHRAVQASLFPLTLTIYLASRGC